MAARLRAAFLLRRIQLKYTTNKDKIKSPRKKELHRINRDEQVTELHLSIYFQTLNIARNGRLAGDTCLLIILQYGPGFISIKE